MRAVPALAAILAVAVLTPRADAQKDKDKECIQKNAMFFGHQMHGWGNHDRPVIGLGTSSGSVRDTLGVLVTSVASNGPAEKAGVEEGDRIATANGVDLRVQAADATDREMRGLMTHRLARTIQKVKAGDPVDLRVYHNGQYHAVKVTTVKSSDLASDDEDTLETGDLPGANFHMPAMEMLGLDHMRDRIKIIQDGVHRL